jgi:hypothetical protein
MSREPWATHPSRGTDPRAMSRGICYGLKMKVLGPSTMSKRKEIGSLEPCPEPRGVSLEPRIKSPEPRAVGREPRDLKMILSVCIDKGKEIGSLDPCPEPRAMSREPWANAPEPGYGPPSREPWDLLRPRNESTWPEHDEQWEGNW